MSAKYFPGQAVPVTLSATVTEGQLVTIAGAPAGDASTSVLGEAMQSGVSGDTITVHRVGIRRLVAGASITQGQPICAAANGQVRPWVTGTDAFAAFIGRALSTAASSASVDVAFTNV